MDKVDLAAETAALVEAALAVFDGPGTEDYDRIVSALQRRGDRGHGVPLRLPR